MRHLLVANNAFEPTLGNKFPAGLTEPNRAIRHNVPYLANLTMQKERLHPRQSMKLSGYLLRITL